MNDLKTLANFAQTLARDAGQAIARAYATQDKLLQAKRMSPKAMKLIEDKSIDQFIVERISAAYPAHGIISEERPALNSDSSYQWIVDPIDGSVNFSTHNPFVAVSIALLIDGQLSLGVIEAPMLQESYLAVRGQGATLNEQALHVSTIDKLSQAYLVSCDGGATDRTEVFSTLVRNFYDQVVDFRKLGSAALECAWVASGRADAYITMAIDPWDVAAGVLLIQEAGGQVTNFNNQLWLPNRQDIICSNGLLHDAIMQRLW